MIFFFLISSGSLSCGCMLGSWPAFEAEAAWRFSGSSSTGSPRTGLWRSPSEFTVCKAFFCASIFGCGQWVVTMVTELGESKRYCDDCAFALQRCQSASAVGEQHYELLSSLIVLLI